jgi:hypothetical protein
MMAVSSRRGLVNNVTDDRDDDSLTSVAFVGNSVFYFNDFPRFFEEMCHGTIVQNSCLHGSASISSLLLEGNSMCPQFATPNAVLGHDKEGNTIYDYGACTAPQLILGRDDRIYDLGYAQPEEIDPNNTNPCVEDRAYLEYAITAFDYNRSRRRRSHPWDFIVINDFSRNPARATTRAQALQTLEQFYVPWLLQTGATPVFLWTYAYTSNPAQLKMMGLGDVANFTSLTGVGYQAYVDLLKLYLPKKQTPRIAPGGLAFLAVYEEDFDLWEKLFHRDHFHASPSGTFLEACVLYYTLFGTMPNYDWVVRDNMASLWKRARMMQHAWEPPNPFPDKAMAEYLYKVAERIMKERHIPESFINYQNGEVAFESG